MIESPVSIGALRKLVKELAVVDRRPLVIGGASELARALERALARDGDQGAIRIGDPRGGALYVHIAAGGDDEPALKRARRARVPIVAVTLGDDDLPYVYATDVVRVGPGEPLPVDRIATAIAVRLGEDGAPLAARLPVLRRAVCDRIVGSFARRNGLLGSRRVLVTGGADLPVLALNQVRMLLLLDQAYGLEIDPASNWRVAQEIAGTVGAGLGLRAVVRALLDLVHVTPGRAALVKGTVAYAGTRALGEAAIRRLELLHG